MNLNSTVRLEQRQAALQSLALGDGELVLQRVRVNVSEIEVEGGNDDREAELGAAELELALNGEPTFVTGSDVEAGAYDTLGLQLRALDGASIVVDGTFRGVAFSYRSAWRPELEFPLSPRVVVPANGEATFSVSFDVGAWFTDSAGALIDPSDSANQSVVERRLIEVLTAQAIEVEQNGDDD